ncbi:hypothetical protein [Xylanivirga thermophila]|uniref:hypothetical protein n=1 Tax=Xylanivirga thermophila TaxID=2496273 RepID=UPI00101CBA2D|nr:hypothetical protein [Xylanivirga thermophila]
MDKSLLVVTEGRSDLLDILRNLDIVLDVVKPNEISNIDLGKYYSIALLGGVSDKPLMLHPKDRILVDDFIDKGGRVFSEYVSSIHELYFSPPQSTKQERLVFCLDSSVMGKVKKGDIMDDQYNMRIVAYREHKNARSVLQYAKYIKAHHNTKIDDDFISNSKDRALWFDRENLLICCFRISNFIRARFTPRDKWIDIICYIVGWLCDEIVSPNDIPKYYSLNGKDGKLGKCIDDGIKWFYNAGILLDEGRMGVLEGIGSEIYPDGTQTMLSNIRADCIGETSMAFMLYSLLKDDYKYMEISNHLTKACFDFFQIKDGQYKGMIRWSNEGWSVCYQDDVARAIMPYLFKCLYLGDKTYINNCIEALDFLVNTTGIDGLRIQRTDNINLTVADMEKLEDVPGNFPSAHYNGYYLASLLLTYRLTGIQRFRDVGIRGMESIIKVYPNTVREHSQTQELCRLVLPSAFLYWITGEDAHREFLYRVVNDLEQYRHSSGSYLEWDEGYKATLSKNEGGECSLLIENGDPVVDMLYSINWLPMAFMQAYFITGDSYFKDLWKNISKFMMDAQISSSDNKLNGGWARGLDVELMEVFASPYDVGWGPWSIESGWTVAEIVSGLIAGCLEEKLAKFY